MTRALTAAVALTTFAACAPAVRVDTVDTTTTTVRRANIEPAVTDAAIAEVLARHEEQVRAARTRAPAARGLVSEPQAPGVRLIPPQNIERGTPSTRQLDALADCESGDHDAKEPFTHDVDAHNGPYHSAFQWSMKSWNSHVAGMGRHDLVGVDPHTLDYGTQREITRGVPLSAFPRQFPGCTVMLRSVGEL